MSRPGWVVGLALLASGCFDIPERVDTGVELDVTSAAETPGGCLDADPGSTCVTVRVEVENEDVAGGTAVDASRWDAGLWAREVREPGDHAYVQAAAVEGGTWLPEGRAATLAIAFNSSLEQRLDVVRFTPTGAEYPTVAHVPSY